MKQLTFEQIRIVQIEMLRKFHFFCKQHNLRYFLDAGTLLGAVRHNGFIPWDDDIDVGMPRPDYERFMVLASKGFGETLCLIKPEQNIYPYTKIIDSSTRMIEFPETIRNETGVYIDVFPKDGLPSGTIRSNLLCKFVFYLVLCNWFCKVSIIHWQNNKSRIKKTIAFFGEKLLTRKIKRCPLLLIDKIARLYGFDESPYVATIVAGGMANCIKRELLSTYELHKFEEDQFYIPIGWHEYLTKLYGDYMTIPPKQKRITHDNIVYLRSG